MSKRKIEMELVYNEQMKPALRTKGTSEISDQLHIVYSGGELVVKPGDLRPAICRHHSRGPYEQPGYRVHTTRGHLYAFTLEEARLMRRMFEDSVVLKIEGDRHYWIDRPECPERRAHLIETHPHIDLP